MTRHPFGIQTFTLTRQHIDLLRASRVRWDDCEAGAAAINSKRPYGNSNVIRDIAKILGIIAGVDEYEEDHFTQLEIDTMLRLHRETEIALQIVLATGSWEPGTYEVAEYHCDWRRKPAEGETYDE